MVLQVSCFVCGLFQIQAITFYSGPIYSDGQDGVAGMLRGSAICTERHPVCTNHNCSATRMTNTCHMSELQAKLDLSMSVFLFCGLGILSMVQNR